MAETTTLTQRWAFSDSRADVAKLVGFIGLFYLAVSCTAKTLTPLIRGGELRTALQVGLDVLPHFAVFALVAVVPSMAVRVLCARSFAPRLAGRPVRALLLSLLVLAPLGLLAFQLSKQVFGESRFEFDDGFSSALIFLVLFNPVREPRAS